MMIDAAIMEPGGDFLLHGQQCAKPENAGLEHQPQRTGHGGNQAAAIGSGRLGIQMPWTERLSQRLRKDITSCPRTLETSALRRLSSDITCAWAIAFCASADGSCIILLLITASTRENDDGDSRPLCPARDASGRSRTGRPVPMACRKSKRTGAGHELTHSQQIGDRRVSDLWISLGRMKLIMSKARARSPSSS